MATAKVSKSSKWFANRSLRLSLNRNGRSKSSSTSSSPTSSRSSPNSPHNITQKKAQKEDELKQVFLHFDEDGDGKISALELSSYFGSIGEYMSHEAAQQVINDLASDGDSMLDYQDFLKLMTGEGGGGNHDDLKKAFEMFELEKGSGYITPKGLQNMLNRLGDAKSYDECVAMIRVYDIDGNGMLDFQEFHQMMA